MRIALIGQAAFGKSVLEAIIKAGRDEVVGVFPPPDLEGRPHDPLKAAALEHGIAIFQPGRYRSDEAIKVFRSLSPDLGVMAFVTDIVPDEMIEAPELGTIQYHPSLLPKHRGPSSINWPIIQGDTTTGLSIFWPDKGLDTGPILLQKEISIGPDDTLGSVYFNHLYPMGVEAMIEGIDLVRSGDPPRIEQDHTQATYESWATPDGGAVDWSMPAQQVYNLIRGCNPQPGASTTRNGELLKLFDAELIAGNGTPGEVLSVNDGGFDIAAGGGAVHMKRVQPPNSRKIPAAEYAAEAGLVAGEVLGS